MSHNGNLTGKTLHENPVFLPIGPPDHDAFGGEFANFKTTAAATAANEAQSL